MSATASITLSQYLPADLSVGEPDVVPGLAVFPLFGPQPRLAYLSFAEGAAAGMTVRELPHGGSVNDLLAENPTDLPVLLYEGEELIGAQQNRTVDHAVLVPARSTLKVPVSCVEHGRWDADRHGEAFTPSTQAAFPGLRRAKSERMRAHMASGLEARADQQDVWSEVSEKAQRMDAFSETDAMSDIYAARADHIAAVQGAVRRRDGQLGALVALGGRFTVLDAVSRPDVFAALHAPLVSGYALDALDGAELDPPAPPSSASARAFLAGLESHPVRTAPAIGLGSAVHFTGRRAGGTGLAVDGELVQLAVYAGDGPVARGIRRPSRRR
jgi:hypothetical protein